MSNPTAIITSDIHLRDDSPECRIDEYKATRARKIEFIRDLQEKYQCPIFDGADIFEKWQVSSELEAWALLNLPDKIITVPGNHDLKYHSLNLYTKGSLHVLEAAGKIIVLKKPDNIYSFSHEGNNIQITGFPYEELLEPPKCAKVLRHVAIIHAHVGLTLPSNIEGYTPKQLLKCMPGYDLIVSGHNHETFIHRSNEGRLVINPGSPFRMFADQENAKPCIFLWYAETNEVEIVYIPIQKKVISRDHIKEKNNTNLDACIERLKGGEKPLSLLFRDNLIAYFKEYKIPKEIRDECWKAFPKEER